MKTFATLIMASAASMLRDAQNSQNPEGNPWADKICWKDTEIRGVGVAPGCCPAGQVKHQGLCYAACPAEYPHQEGPRCYKSCAQRDDEYTVNTVASCRKPNTGLLRPNESVGRGVGHVPSLCCDANRHKEDGLCYTQCSADYVGVGPVCWRRCTGEFPANGGAMCCKSRADCNDFIWDQTKSIFQIIISALNPVTAMNAVKQSADMALDFVLPVCGH